MKRRARGFTLVELLCYLALLTAGLMVLAGLEYTAGRAAFLERALIDLGREADLLGTHFRDDVRQALKVRGPELAKDAHQGTLLAIELPNGSVVHYDVDAAEGVEPITDARAPGIRTKRVRLVRKLFTKAADAIPVSVEVTGNVEQVQLVHDASARGRPTWRLEVTLAYRRGPELAAQRSYVAEAVPLVEESP